MATCAVCGKSGFGFLEVKQGECPSCRRQAEAEEAAKANEKKETERQAQAAKLKTASAMTVTTEAWIGDVDRLGVVAAEVVLGMNIFKDVLANVRDVFGGRSGTVQKTLEQARIAAFDDLRSKASDLGANAIIAVDIDYHTISTGASVNMMMVAVSGTAVRIKQA